MEEGLLETGHPYPDVIWKVEGGVLFMRFASSNQGENSWDYIFSPSKWAWIETE